MAQRFIRLVRQGHLSLKDLHFCGKSVFDVQALANIYSDTTPQIVAKFSPSFCLNSQLLATELRINFFVFHGD